MRVHSNASQYWRDRLGGSGAIAGYIDVYWNGSAKKNCAVGTYANKAYGKSILSHVGISISGQSGRDEDRGTYRYYAGPVYTAAQKPGACINAFFFMFPSNGSPAVAGRTIGYAHCG